MLEHPDCGFLRKVPSKPITTNESATFESTGSTRADAPSPRRDDRFVPDGAAVLESAIENERFVDGKATVVCPGCAEHVETFDDGLPRPFAHFAATCDSCDVELHRWSAVVVPGALSPVMLSNTGLRALVEAHWEDKFREGVENDGLPHTREFGEACEDLAAEWGWDWTVSCPLCNRPCDELPRDYLGYHHWSYTQDVGTSLCDDCHDFLHGVDDDGHRRSAANEQDWRARQVGLRDFRDLATIRLAMRDCELNDPDTENYSRYLKHRYNVPLSEERIETLLSDARNCDRVQNVLQEHGGSASLDARDVRGVSGQ